MNIPNNFFRDQILLNDQNLVQNKACYVNSFQWHWYSLVYILNTEQIQALYMKRHHNQETSGLQQKMTLPSLYIQVQKCWHYFYGVSATEKHQRLWIFATANCDLAFNGNPSTVRYANGDIRRFHLIACLEAKQINPFPRTGVLGHKKQIVLVKWYNFIVHVGCPKIKNFISHAACAKNGKYNVSLITFCNKVRVYRNRNFTVTTCTNVKKKK